MPKSTITDIQFLAGGGEMGQLIREKDWSQTPLGNPETWPQSLRTTLGILLNSKFPMFLWWGPELICFYNDAYRPSLGKEGKHPSILGMNASDAWPEIWDIIKPMIDSVISTGKATWNEDSLIPIYRNNKIEDVYWTFSYSPVYDENSEVAGVLVTCNETTDKVNAFKELKENNQRFLNNISQAPVAMCILRGKEYVVEMANDLMLEIWGKETSVVMNKPLFNGLPEIQDQGIKTMLDNVYATGEKFVANEWELDILRNGKTETVYVNFVCEALRESDGTISGIIGTATEITKQVNSRIKLEETEQKIRALVENAPFAIAVYTGEEMRIELANQAIMDIWGKGNDVIGKTFTEVLPELAGQSVFEQIKEVYTTGKPFHNENQALDLVVNGRLGTYYFNYDFIPLYDLSGKIYGVMNTGVNLTDLNLTKQKIEESNSRFKNTVKQAPVGMIILRGKDYVVEMVNDAYMKIVDFNESEFVGLPLFDSIPEAKESTLSLMDQVMDTGEPYYGYEVTVPLRRNNKIEFCNFDFVYHPLKEDDGSISGMIVTVTDVTEKVASRRKIEESEARFRNTVKQSPVGIAILRGKTYMVELANDTYLQLVDKKESEFLNRPLFDSLPEIKESIHSLLDGVMDTGEEYHGNEMPIPVMRNGKIDVYYFDFLYRPLKEDDGTISGIIVTVTDVTEKVESHKKIERNEERLNIVIEASELGTWELNLKTREIQYSQRYLEILGGYKERMEFTHEQLKQHVHPDDTEIREKAINDALANGYLHYEGRTIWEDKSVHWIEGRGRVFYDEKGKPEKMIGTIRDITNERMFTQELEKQVNERTKELKKLNETLKQSEKRYHLMVEEIQDYAILYMTKEGVVENWNKGAEKIKGYKAEEIIGKNFSTFYTHEDRKNQLPEYLLKQAILHGRHRHEGWRVRKDGTRFWASVVITAVHNDDNEIIGFSKVTHDLTTKKEADDKIKLNSEILEQKNKELEKMNKELQSFAYISSHDLQEPLRKIQTFADQIVERESENLSENGKDKFRRMQNAAKRMQTLINDLLAYSRTTNQDVELIKVNLNSIIEDVKEDLKEEIQQKNATIEIGQIGEANIIPFQFHQLMFNLLSNALKFSRKDVPLHVTIQGEIAEGTKFNNNKLDKEKQYSHIIFSDNGIGFEQQYGEKIFEVFQRLHGKEVYQGTGIGLAIVKKIVDNHKGIITAKGELGKGATFDIYIPVN